MPNFTDLSVDLETLGTEPGAVITQIGLASRANAETNGKDACKPSVLDDCDLLNTFEARAGGKIAFGSKVASDNAA